VNFPTARLHAFAETLGASGAVGAGLIVLGASLYFSLLAPAQDDLDLLRGKIERAARGRGTSLPGDQSSEQLKQFFALLPPSSDAPRWVMRMHQLAERDGLTLESGEYRMERSRDWPVANYRITLPIHGSYPQIRRYIDDLLREVPAAALEDLAIQRDNVSAADVDAKVRLTLYLVDSR
jgi:hypothetical protein